MIPNPQQAPDHRLKVGTGFSGAALPEGVQLIPRPFRRRLREMGSALDMGRFRLTTHALAVDSYPLRLKSLLCLEI